MSRRHPKMKREKSGLHGEPRDKERERHAALSRPGEITDDTEIDTARGGVGKCDTQQQKQAAGKASGEVIECRPDRGPAVRQRRETNGGKAEDLERDVEVEEIVRQEESIHRPERHQPERPESGAETRRPFIPRRTKSPIRRLKRHAGADQSCHHDHHYRQPVGDEGDSERRRPPPEGGFGNASGQRLLRQEPCDHGVAERCGKTSERTGARERSGEQSGEEG